MENILIEGALSHGLWASGFVFLFIWTLREHKQREREYREVIRELTQKFGRLDESVRKLTEKLKKNS